MVQNDYNLVLLLTIHARNNLRLSCTRSNHCIRRSHHVKFSDGRCARWGERPTTSASLPLRHVVAGMNNRCFAYLFVFCCQLVSFRIWNVGLNKELLVCVLPVGFAPICTDRYYTAAIDSTRQHLITKGSVAEKSGAASEFFNTIYGLYRGTTTSRLGRTRNTQSRA